jgi:UDP-N-acetylglucosamine 2-epimerase (non-hydrolysing)
VAKIAQEMPTVLANTQPDAILVQGDTSSAFATALTAFHAKVAVGHVEAGLRTGNRHNPFPEEMNRRLVGVLADWHFAPTAASRDNLLREGIDPGAVTVTGNTVIDTLLYMLSVRERLPRFEIPGADLEGKRVICVTTHRRESFGEPLLNTLRALQRIVSRFRDVAVVLPVHYNPNVRERVYEQLGNVERIHLIDPLAYEQFVQLLDRCTLVLTDSGGVQEEAPSLGKPVLVLRETTERPEGVSAGVARLVGTDSDLIVQTASELLENPRAYEAMARAASPYGDGTASRQIVDRLEAEWRRMRSAPS